jgi:acyl dehydratase
MTKDDKCLYLEDLQVGQRFESGPHALDAEQIKRFAADFDPQPFHTDEEAAKGSFFGSLAASGWHTAAITMRLLTESVPLAGGLIGAKTEMTWPRPTWPGSTLHVESEIESITPSRSKPDRGIVVMFSKTLDQDGEVLQTLRVTMIAFKRIP